NVAFAQHLSGETKSRKRNTAEIQAGAAIAAAAANAPTEITASESPSMEASLERAGEPAPSSSSASTTAELESSVVPAGSEIEVTPDPALDRGYGDSSTVPAPGQDPALETDQTKMATEFATQFGTSETEPAPENVDAEFEARVAAAMSGYGSEPAMVTEAISEPE